MGILVIKLLSNWLLTFPNRLSIFAKSCCKHISGYIQYDSFKMTQPSYVFCTNYPIPPYSSTPSIPQIIIHSSFLYFFLCLIYFIILLGGSFTVDGPERIKKISSSFFVFTKTGSPPGLHCTQAILLPFIRCRSSFTYGLNSMPIC